MEKLGSYSHVLAKKMHNLRIQLGSEILKLTLISLLAYVAVSQLCLSFNPRCKEEAF